MENTFKLDLCIGPETRTARVTQLRSELLKSSGFGRDQHFPGFREDAAFVPHPQELQPASDQSWSTCYRDFKRVVADFGWQ